MGRETKILLGLLATLTGIFVGVLSVKLLVPRPPDGAGPDIHSDVAAEETHDLVEPPQLGGPDDSSTTAAVPNDETPQQRPSRFASVPTAPLTPDAAMPAAPKRDPFIAAATFDQPQDAPRREPDAMPPGQHVPAAEPATARPESTAGAYVARPGDSWWLLAERSYGDGRFYRALFAWNRSLDPRVSLVPGTPIEIPPPDRLQAAWPALLPKD